MFWILDKDFKLCSDFKFVEWEEKKERALNRKVIDFKFMNLIKSISVQC